MNRPDDLNAAAPLEGGITRPDNGREHIRRPIDETFPRNYYDVPMLKPPVWTWEIASYFFLGGLSGGSFALARMADRFGGKTMADVRRIGTLVAFSAFLPCPALLIADLGDRKRFHYMLRVFKPKSPMNFGAWVLSLFGGVLTIAVLKEWLLGRARGKKGRIFSVLSFGTDLLSDFAGVPLGLLLAGYTGVLLSTTATPIWARNRWLGPLFSAGAISSGAAAIGLAEAAMSGKRRRSGRPLRRVEMASRVAEAAALGGFLLEAGRLAKPLTHGKYAAHLWVGAVGLGLALPTLLSALPGRFEKSHRWLKTGSAAASLAGVFALRWAITQAGTPSANDPQAARDVSRPAH